MARKCEGHFNNGAPCTANARFSSNYCARHATQAPKPCPTNLMTLVNDRTIEFRPEGGGLWTGTPEALNALLATMDYAPVAVRRNMMSQALYLEAKDTPIYCSPASESYWSM